LSDHQQLSKKHTKRRVKDKRNEQNVTEITTVLPKSFGKSPSTGFPFSSAELGGYHETTITPENEFHLSNLEIFFKGFVKGVVDFVKTAIA
jgi:hypothetical protein